jgi:hypothetical protein
MMQEMQSSIDIILDRVKAVLKDLEGQDISAKVASDKDARIIKIYGEGSDYVKRARSGLADIQELAYSTAEHHPYWAILYHASEISRMALERWESRLTSEALGEMSWRCDEIKMVLERLDEKH